MVRKPGIPIRPGRDSGIKSLEDLGRAALLMAQAHTDADLQDQTVANSNAEFERSQTRMRHGLAGLGGLSSILALVVVAQQIYFRGYDAGRAQVEDEVADAEPIVPGPPPAADTSVGKAPSVEALAAEKLQATLVALSVLQTEQQDYMTAVLAAQAVRKKMPPKPDSLLRAESVLRQLQKAP